ncbi:MAG: M24 family metallopeptidase, partial [Verrucomicrobiae bacterium]|nr:M24 family metallopeptidase [Verrucomicrobiae bacterium]
MRRSCEAAVDVLDQVVALVVPGRTTRELNEAAAEFIRAKGGKSAFLGYKGYKGHICVSVNEEVVHGIPDGRILVEGDIVKIDIGVTKDGFIADGARTFEVGRVQP